MFSFRRPQRNDRPDASGQAEAQTPPPDARFEAIRERFVTRVRDDYATLAQYRQSGPSRAQELMAVAHRLAGSAGMVGYTELGVAAGRLDDALVETDADIDAPFRDLLAVLEKTIAPAKSN